jgi:hypothetical protein
VLADFKITHDGLLSPNKLLSWEYQLGIRERELNERANTTLGNRASSVRQHISALGKSVGSPWTQDEKTAALAALIISETNGAGFKPLQ